MLIVARLLAGFGSLTPLRTVAALVISGGAAVPPPRCRWRRWFASVPGAIVPRSQGKAVVQSPLVDTNVNPAGVGSSTLTPVAAEGPALATVTA